MEKLNKIDPHCITLWTFPPLLVDLMYCMYTTCSKTVIVAIGDKTNEHNKALAVQLMML